MSDVLEITAPEVLIKQINEVSDDLSISQEEASRRLIRLGLDDHEMLGEDILLVTED